MPSSTELIKELRDKTGAGIMECKKAIEDALGDVGKAEQLIKERGLAMAEKKAGREAGQGLIETYVHAGRIGALIELNCETDFVARDEGFRSLARELAMQIAAMSPEYVSDEDAPADLPDDERKAKVRALAGDFPALWADPATPQRERKRMIRELAELL